MKGVVLAASGQSQTQAAGNRAADFTKEDNPILRGKMKMLNTQ